MLAEVLQQHIATQGIARHKQGSLVSFAYVLQNQQQVCSLSGVVATGEPIDGSATPPEMHNEGVPSGILCLENKVCSIVRLAGTLKSM